ncbi:glutathione S-transferase N-terminal domain-containing protein [Parvibaculum sp.]|uniref:glutathione S-transferase N-terminal domain-containing protein n=1 Tax=Alphaproteobacteria TaxID=28211 RepID=UPI001B191D2D|nr:glutathione S-transferase N-terminal domain-containing protein [Parvibaculum sp.]MBO6691371.1 glutathione S-transferase N-terminal domain-containing protein [Parvibaculum sp.]MBO6715317.1 glutathione S-transferase N-terminal domain-containing protein [Parvibaculum sp.]
MIDVHFWPTPNGWKVTILLEETGLPYRLVPVDLGAGAQLSPEFLSISPNGRMPAIVDPDGPGGQPIAIFESGAILQYLADKAGAFYPSERRVRSAVEQWLYWQCAGLGPMVGQAGHFNYLSEKIPYALERYTAESRRLYGVLDRHLAGREFVADDYSIADMAIWPWIRGYKMLGVDLKEFPSLRAWFRRVGAREAVVRGADIGKAEFALQQNARLQRSGAQA